MRNLPTSYVKNYHSAVLDINVVTKHKFMFEDRGTLFSLNPPYLVHISEKRISRFMPGQLNFIPNETKKSTSNEYTCTNVRWSRRIPIEHTVIVRMTVEAVLMCLVIILDQETICSMHCKKKCLWNTDSLGSINIWKGLIFVKVTIIVS